MNLFPDRFKETILVEFSMGKEPCCKLCTHACVQPYYHGWKNTDLLSCKAYLDETNARDSRSIHPIVCGGHKEPNCPDFQKIGIFEAMRRAVTSYVAPPVHTMS